MKDIQKEFKKVVEKIIDLRIEDIIKQCDFDNKINNDIINTNKIISNEKIKMKNKKSLKIKIPKDEKKMNPYTLYIKDVTNIIKDKNNLNYLPNEIINKIKVSKDKKRNEQFRDFSIIWNELPDEIKNKYKELCKNKDFTNEKYKEVISKSPTPKIPRKKKSKESLK
jgi:hypothetical protein